MNKTKYTFTKETKLDYIENCGKICNVPYLGEHEEVKFYGSLLALFGQPRFSSNDMEASFDYIIKAKSGDEEVFLSAYCGPSGPAIGGSSAISETDEVVSELITLIKDTAPSDYDYVGYYTDASVKIECGIKQGKVYYHEEYMEYEEMIKRMEE